MKDDEIKETINYFKDDIAFLEQELKNPNFLGRYITIKDKEYNYLKILLNYITNLQQENERLKELVNPKTQIFIDTQDMEERYGEELYKEYLEKQVKDYKSRCEKAVEYINSKKRTITKYEAEDTRLPMDTFMYGVDNLLNILNGKE